MPYQDCWVRGATAARGERACESRYALIREAVVEGFDRPITVLDIGANLGYFGCRLADEFGAVAVMIEGRAELVESCRANALPTTIALKRKVSVQDLRELAASEHFDVVLALNVLHHFQDSLGALAAVLDMGTHVIIETPSRDDVKACGQRSHGVLLDAVDALNPDILGYTSSHVTKGAVRPLYRLQREKQALTSGYAYRSRLGGNPAVRPHIIDATLSQKTIMYASGEERDWYPGMNLWNFCQLGGIYPDREAIVSQVIKACEHIEHGDIRPWNFILQGAQVVPIDTAHRTRHSDEASLEETLAWIRDPEIAYTRRQ